MLNGIFVCPACKARVFPNADDLCPACRSYDFRRQVAIGPAPIPRDPVPQDRQQRLFCAAVLFRRYLLLIAAHLVSFLTLGVAGEVFGRASWATSAAEWTAGVLLVVIEVTMLFFVVKISKHLAMGSPTLWVIGMLVPYLGTLVFFGFIRSVMNAFKGHGVRVGHFGPSPQSLRPRPASEGAA